MEQRAETQQQGENNKTTRADNRGKTGREQKNGTGGSNNAQRHLYRIYMRAQPSPGCVGKVRHEGGQCH